MPMPTERLTKRHKLSRPDARALNVLGNKWACLVLAELSAGPERFVRLQERVPGISTEALRVTLGRLVEAGFLSRTRHREVPPRVDYELTDLGTYALKVVNTLAMVGDRMRPAKDERHADQSRLIVACRKARNAR